MLPAAVSLRKQGATQGATTAFLISTPESGVDSIAVTWAMMDPVMTVARPASAFITAFVAGVAENFFSFRKGAPPAIPDLTCPVDGCCDGVACDPKVHRNHHSFGEKLKAGLKFAVTDLWGDMAPWFFLGLLLAGLITVIIPDDLFSRHLGSGLPAMLLMLAVGIPLYICATASTPIAAALILKGVSPGAALVFLLAGPATNMASITVLLGTMGKRATVIYLASIAVCSVLLGLAVDHVYAALGISAKAAAGQAAEVFPAVLQWIAAVAVVAISVKPTVQKLKSLIEKKGPAAPVPARMAKKESAAEADCAPDEDIPMSSGPRCSGVT
ncbi:MAG: SO_0444 family Cu/Zn efflux transporter [Desulfobacterales bacterium]|nr:SO_0444 family Cu/Zn efflux transporter [Desulfobacterales bacterium]